VGPIAFENSAITYFPGASNHGMGAPTFTIPHLFTIPHHTNFPMINQP
jgi:hypothetical protein